jgi:hypothetical protein
VVIVISMASSTGRALVSGGQRVKNPIAAADKTAKRTMTQPSPIPFFQAGNASMSAWLASQSAHAARAAARPRTGAGKTSPWISQPVPPTPMNGSAEPTLDVSYPNKNPQTPDQVLDPHLRSLAGKGG